MVAFGTTLWFTLVFCFHPAHLQVYCHSAKRFLVDRLSDSMRLKTGDT